MADAEYVVGRLASFAYTVAKFEGTSEPTAVYMVRRNKQGHWECDCPARGTCKHQEMVMKAVLELPPVL